MHALGRLMNYRHIADGGYISLKDADSASFLCYLGSAAGDTYTLNQAQDASGTGAKALTALTEYFTCTGDGSDTWTRTTQAAASTVVTSATAAQQSMCCEVEAAALDAGFTYVKLTSTGAGLVTAMTHDLEVQRRPNNLPALGV